LNFKRTALPLVMVLLPGLATAATAAPGETTVLDNNTSQNGTQAQQIVSNQLPSNINLSISTGNLTATPSYDLYPDNYTGEVELDNGHNQTYTVEVPEKFNWTLTPDELNGTISVGSSGQINTTEIQLESNVNPEFSGKIKGNISKFFSVDRFQFEETGLYTAVLGYGVNENTQFGNYSGQLVVEGNQGENQTVNLSYVFEDRISPEIADVDVSDVMSTKSGSFSVVTRDNLGVDGVCTEISREVEVVRNNQKVLENQTLGNSPYCFKQQTNTNLWQLEFTDTDEISTYYANITVSDKSGNNASQLEIFKVEGLDAVEVLNSNFVFEAVNPTTATNQESKATNKILRLKKSTPVNLTLDTLTHGSPNSTLEEGIGIRKEGEDAAKTLTESQTITIEEEGDYVLVAESNKIESYHGEIVVDTVPQHVEIPDRIVFDGQIKDPVYPDCNNMSIGEFEGRICFADPDKAEQDRIQFEATAPADDCKGVDSWNQCITGYSLGEIPSIESQAKSDRFWRNIAIAFAALIGLIEIGARAKESLEDQIMIQAFKS